MGFTSHNLYKSSCESKKYQKSVPNNFLNFLLLYIFFGFYKFASESNVLFIIVFFLERDVEEQERDRGDNGGNLGIIV